MGIAVARGVVEIVVKIVMEIAVREECGGNCGDGNDVERVMLQALFGLQPPY